MNDDQVRMWKEEVIAKFQDIFQYFPGETEENHKRPQPE
jgi:hypothetical protein